MSDSTFWLDSKWLDEFRRHAGLIHGDCYNLFNNKEDDRKLSEALAFFGWKIDIDFDNPSSITDPETTQYDIQVVRDLDPKTSINPASNPDFSDIVKELDLLLRKLSHEIRSINDPSRFSPELRVVRAYIDSFREFLDNDGGQPPDAIPTVLVNELHHNVDSFNWIEISKQAKDWAALVVGIIKVIF